MKTHDQVRESVSNAYANAVRDTGGCCGGNGDCATATLAGYSQETLTGIPGDAVNHAFGCGNPLSYASVEPGSTVLDLGSGAGIDILLAARHAGPAGRVIGVDMTDQMLDRARRNIAESGLTNVEVRKGIIEDLPVESGTVDWVISNCVINLSPEKDRVFAEIARALKPGGRMLVSDVVVEELPDELRANEALYHGCIGGAISESNYLNGLRRAGLEDVEVRQRFVYDAAHLEHLLGKGLHGDDGGSCCGVGPDGGADAHDVAGTMAGKIWSVQVFARKP